MDYSYNIRGWLTKINEIGSLQQGTDPADLFSFKLNYNTVDGNASAASPLFNGNIAETFWQTGADGNLVYRGYGYKYDSLNRLKDATYQKTGGILNNYDENLTYDKNGNILSLMRMGNSDTQSIKFLIDELKYEYTSPTSNQLAKVTEGVNGNSSQGFIVGNTSGNDYEYDANGNMTVDKNKNITSIVYNHLNLPTKIIFTTGNIVYFYNASGQKVQKVVTENATVTTTDYLSGYQYKNLVLQYFPTVEGYVEPNLSSFKYVFQYKDHLGNVRLSYTKDTTTGSLKILEESNYYPFGLKHNSYNVDNFQPGYKYKLNGKEWQDELGLNFYDYQARNYDPALGRWMNMNPLAEQSRRWSPYNYAYNNPIIFVDPDGMQAVYNWDDGKYYDNGKVVSFDQAMASHGLNANGSEKTEDNNEEQNNDSFGFQDPFEQINSKEEKFNSLPSISQTSEEEEAGGPPYEYNGQMYETKSELYMAILMDQAAEQFGIKDIAALAAVIDN